MILEPQELKIILDKARQAQSDLVEKHNYTKYANLVDFFELSFCNNYLTADAQRAITSRLMGGNDPYVKVKTRCYIMNRQANIYGDGARMKHLMLNANLLGDEKYKESPIRNHSLL